MKSISGKIITVLFLLTASIFGQNPNDALRLSDPGIYSNAKIMGSGNSNIALGGDYASGLINPATLALAGNSSLTGGFLFNSLENKTNFFNRSTTYNNNSNQFSQFGVVIPLPTRKGSMVFSAGYSRLNDFNNAIKFNGLNPANNSMIQDLTFNNDDIAYDLKLSYGIFSGNDWLYDETNIQGNLNQSGSILDKGSNDSWNFSGAVEIAQGLFVGATLNIYSGSFKRDREYYEDDLNNVYQGPLNPDHNSNDFKSFEFMEMIDWDLSGWDAKFGLLYKMNKNLNLGVTIKTPSQYTVKETYYLAASSHFGTGLMYEIDPYESKIEYDITTPIEFAAGLGYKFKGLEVSAQGALVDYTQMEFTDGLTPEHRINNNKMIKENFKSVFSYNGGVSYSLPYFGSTVRAGFIVKPSAYNGDPSEFDKKYFTAGIGIIASGVLGIDFAYVHGWWKTYGDNYGFDVSRTYQTVSTDNIIFSITYGI